MVIRGTPTPFNHLYRRQSSSYRQKKNSDFSLMGIALVTCLLLIHADVLEKNPATSGAWLCFWSCLSRTCFDALKRVVSLLNNNWCLLCQGSAPTNPPVNSFGRPPLAPSNHGVLQNMLARILSTMASNQHQHDDVKTRFDTGDCLKMLTSCRASVLECSRKF